MQVYNVEFSNALSKNTKLTNIPLASNRKGPYKPNSVTIYKDNNGRVYNSYEKPVTLNIDNHKIPNVVESSVVNYQDGVTNHGKFYNILTPESEVSLYTQDGKFNRATEYFRDKQTLKINGNSVRGFLTKTTLEDGTQNLEVISKNFARKFVRLDANGQVIAHNIKPSVTLSEKFLGVAKKLGKMLMF